MELQPGVQSSLEAQIYFDTSRKLLKKRNQSFPELHYFIWKLEFVSYILSMIVGYRCVSIVPQEAYK